MKDPTHLFEGEISPERILLARRISVYLQPTIITIPTFLILCLPLLPDWGAYLIAALVTTLFLSVFLTILVYHFSRKTNNVDGDIVKREERITPMLVAILFYLAAGVAVLFIEAPQIVKVFTWVYPVSTTVMFVISLKWKISLHMSGIAGPVAALGTALFPWGWIAAVLLPIVAWARYVQRKHTPAQLIGGTVEGFCVTLAMFALFL
jgi:hypothetical protein